MIVLTDTGAAAESCLWTVCNCEVGLSDVSLWLHSRFSSTELGEIVAAQQLNDIKLRILAQ